MDEEVDNIPEGRAQDLLERVVGLTLDRDPSEGHVRLALLPFPWKQFPVSVPHARREVACESTTPQQWRCGLQVVAVVYGYLWAPRSCMKMLSASRFCLNSLPSGSMVAAMEHAWPMT